MKPGAEDVPYVFERRTASTWVFQLLYASLENFIPIAQQMLLASRLDSPERSIFLSTFLRDTVEKGRRFDPGHLKNPATETIVADIPVLLRTPLVQESGRFAVTNDRVYFQPIHTIFGESSHLSHPLSAVSGVARRRSSLRDVGIELFFARPKHESSNAVFWDAPSAFFSFTSEEDREMALSALLAQECIGMSMPGGRAATGAASMLLDPESGFIHRVTRAWQLGRVSNFEYILYCNLVAGRTFNDLTQYPIFPWILSDYTSSSIDLHDPSVFRDLSKPVGALDPKRLECYRQRYASLQSCENCPEPPFLYGTHYSCPGYCLFWLVRAAPGHMLRLQNGRFDSPDRLFCSMAETWASVLSNPADVKELIPEFFMQNPPDFLRNSLELPLGIRQSGKPVSDVELPPWSCGTEDFLAQHRAALESPYVSANLHHWIDLIFGYKQSGEEAEMADNVFRSLTYEGSVDLDGVDDPNEKIALETQINEFGQCPRQLFRHPHPKRLRLGSSEGCNDENAHFHRRSRNSMGGQHRYTSRPQEGSYTSPATAPTEAGGAQEIACALISAMMAAVMEGCESRSADASLGESCMGPTVKRDVRLEELDVLPEEDSSRASWSLEKRGGPLKGCRNGSSTDTHVSPDSSSVHKDKAGALCSFETSQSSREADSALQMHATGSLVVGKNARSVVNAVKVHTLGTSSHQSAGGDAIAYAYTASHDGFLRVFNVSAGGDQVRAANIGNGHPLGSLSLLLPSRTHTFHHPLILVGTFDGRVCAYSAENGRTQGHFFAHADVVSCIEVVHADGHLVTASWDGSVCVWNPSPDLWEQGNVQTDSVSQGEMGACVPKHAVRGLQSIWSLSLCPEAAFHSRYTVVLGHDDGTVSCWDIQKNCCLWQRSLSDDYIGGVVVDHFLGVVFVAAADGRLYCLESNTGRDTLEGSECGGPLRCCVVLGSHRSGHASWVDVCVGREDGSAVLLRMEKKNGDEPSWGEKRLAAFGDIPLQGGSMNALDVSSAAPLKKEAGQVLVSGHENGALVFWVVS